MKVARSTMPQLLQFFHRTSLDAKQLIGWNRFLLSSPRSHYLQSPDWAEVERRTDFIHQREPSFFWAESDGEIRLTALIMRQRLPLPGRRYIYRISKGPVFNDIEVLEQSLPDLMGLLEKDALELQVSPYWELSKGGDEIETALEKSGFTRRRIDGKWASLRLELAPPQEELLQSLHQATRRNIRKGQKAGIVVRREDQPEGWQAFIRLQEELSTRKHIRPLLLDNILRLEKHWLRNGERGTILIARYDGRAIGGAIIVNWREAAFYWAGASSRVPARSTHQSSALLGCDPLGKSQWLRDL